MNRTNQQWSKENSPRSQLDALSKSYHEEGKVFQPKTIDLQNAAFKLSDNDERLLEKLKQAIVAQRQVFQKKVDMFNAVQRNFEILKKLCKQQQEEFKASMDHANVIKDQFRQLSNKYTDLEELKEKADEENIYY